MESEGINSSLSSVNIDQENSVPVNNEHDGKDIKVEDIPDDCGKRKRTSEMWNHFKRLKVDDTIYAEFNYCKTRLKGGSAHGTSHLTKHYEKSCKKGPRKMDIRQSFLQANKKASGSQELISHTFNQEDSRKKLAVMVMLHDYPLNIVEHIGFRKFVGSLQPCFKILSRNTLKSDIIEIYKEEKTKWYKVLDKLMCQIAITTDTWTSKNSKKGFMAITAHFIEDSWILQNCILRFAYVPAPHTAAVISDVLVDSLMDWNIDRKVCTVTVDNCSTNDSMLRVILDKISQTDPPLDGKVLHMRCCAHILNLIVRDGLDVICDAIERIRGSVVYWTASPAKVEKFEENARQLHINCTKKLSLDCKTRWNSTYLMLETAIQYKDVFPRVKHRERHYKSLPTDDDWEKAIEICGKLRIFYQVTEMFSGTQYPTSNFYFSKICDIKIKLDEWVKSPKKHIQDMAEKMLEKYLKYWDSCHIIMGVAAVLDPRYKMQLVEFYFPLIYGERSQSKVGEVRKNCYDLLSDYHSRASTLMESSSTSGFENISGTSCLTDEPEIDTLDMFDKFVASKARNFTKSSITSELDMHLDEIILPRAPGFDILSWWKTNGVKYPNLQKMARDILAIIVSTVAFESVFSTSGRLLSPHRSRLHPTTLEALMCGRRWLWNETKSTCATYGGTFVCPSINDEEEDDEDCVTEDDE